MKKIVFILIFISQVGLTNSIIITNNIEGDGKEIVNHSKIKVHYIGTLEDGTVFDSSYDRGNPFRFQIGLRQVIEGWEQGLLGMKVGGKRTLLIPPQLAYGDKGAGELIPPNASLIFDINIIDVQDPSYKLVMTNEIEQLQKENFKFIDIRTNKERENTGIISGSLEITAFDIYGNFVPEFMKTFQDLVDLNDNIIFISNKGDISSILANGFAEQFGASNIHSLKGGIQQLIKENYKLSKK
ncbi:MAG: FKBP-type peptidyl-prolyl cis-trans isomerase [Alphaproteobacteria bacterium]